MGRIMVLETDMKSIFKSSLVIVILSLTPLACSGQPSSTSTTAPPYLSKLGTIEKDIAYSFTDLFNLKLDVYYPSSAPGPMASVMYLHGGAWVGGDKSSAANSPEVIDLVKRGFLVASVNYGLAPQFSILEQIENAKCAVRFLRANTSRFGIDPNRIGVIGESAGGHLAAVLGTADKTAGLDGVGGFADQSSRLGAVVDFYGPTDLRVLFNGYPPIVLQELIGTSDPNSVILDKINPLTYVSADDPPFLIIQGGKDTVVPPSQSQDLYDKLQTTGVASTLVVVKNAEHSFTPAGGAISPTRTEITATVADYFVTRLK